MACIFVRFEFVVNYTIGVSRTNAIVFLFGVPKIR